MTHYSFEGHEEEKEAITVTAALEIRQEIWQRSDLLAAKRTQVGVHTSPTALTLFPSTNIPMGIPLRFGQLLMLWPEGPVFTTL